MVILFFLFLNVEGVSPLIINYYFLFIEIEHVTQLTGLDLAIIYIFRYSSGNYFR